MTTVFAGRRAVDPSTRARVAAGVLAAPLFLVVSAVQMPFNPGFDLTEHAFSFLSIGDTGRLQQANFVVLGLLNIVAATGVLRAIPGKPRIAAAVLLGLVGAGQVVAGVFTLDPSYGFPEGAPEGRPETVSVHGNLHGLGFAISMVSWVSLFLVLARWQARRGDTAWARANVAFAIALLVTAACLMTPFGTVLLYVVLTSAWLYTSVLLRQLVSSSP
jgi:hypothetical protein